MFETRKEVKGGGGEKEVRGRGKEVGGRGGGRGKEVGGRGGSKYTTKRQNHGSLE